MVTHTHSTYDVLQGATQKEKVMLIVSLFVCIQQSIERFQTRKKLAKLSAEQLNDIGMTKERQQIEVSQATFLQLLRDVVLRVKNARRAQG